MYKLESIAEFLERPAPAVSFEFFPPKTDEMAENLWETIKALEKINPSFVSVTYGAGGSTRKRTHQTVKRIKQESSLAPAAHLTCVNATRPEIDEIAKSYLDIGVNHIVALRGDPPEGSEKYIATEGGYKHSIDLINGLKNIGDFEISVAAFPETHPEAKSSDADLQYLKEKIDAGADRAITQFFFDPEIYLKFRDETQKIGITKPIIPGIVLISNFKQLLRFADMCKTSVPKWLHNLLDNTDDNPETRNMLSAIIAAEQCRILRQEGVEHFHFYTLNRPKLALAVCRVLGLKG